eukprot:4795829-Amphidinium_carterae.1
MWGWHSHIRVNAADPLLYSNRTLASDLGVIPGVPVTIVKYWTNSSGKLVWAMAMARRSTLALLCCFHNMHRIGVVLSGERIGELPSHCSGFLLSWCGLSQP